MGTAWEHSEQNISCTSHKLQYASSLLPFSVTCGIHTKKLISLEYASVFKLFLDVTNV
jgi:hypothetical protein